MGLSVQITVGYALTPTGWQVSGWDRGCGVGTPSGVVDMRWLVPVLHRAGPGENPPG